MRSDGVSQTLGMRSGHHQWGNSDWSPEAGVGLQGGGALFFVKVVKLRWIPFYEGYLILLHKG